MPVRFSESLDFGVDRVTRRWCEGGRSRAATLAFAALTLQAVLLLAV